MTTATDDRIYIATYDIADPKRWRRVFNLMNGYGEWLQLSVFQCRLNRRRRAEMEARLRELINFTEDHVLLIDVGPAAGIDPRIESIGREYNVIERKALVI